MLSFSTRNRRLGLGHRVQHGVERMAGHAIIPILAVVVKDPSPQFIVRFVTVTRGTPTIVLIRVEIFAMTDLAVQTYAKKMVAVADASKRCPATSALIRTTLATAKPLVATAHLATTMASAMPTKPPLPARRAAKSARNSDLT